MAGEQMMGVAMESPVERAARLARELAALTMEMEALAVWVEGQEARQARLEVLAAVAEEERQDRDRGIIWIS